MLSLRDEFRGDTGGWDGDVKKEKRKKGAEI